MKTNYLLFLGFFSLLLGACSDTENLAPEIVIDDASSTVKMSYKPGVSVSVPFTSTTSWIAETNDEQDLDISPASGSSGRQSLAVKMRTANQTSKERTFHFTIKAQGSTTNAGSRTVKVEQPPVFVLEKNAYEADPEGGVLSITFTSALDINHLAWWRDSNLKEMTVEEENRSVTEPLCITSVTRAADNDLVFTIELKPNDTGKMREGTLFFAEKDVTKEFLNDPASLISEVITITQNPKDSGSSSDFSQDGKTFTLQEHSQGTVGMPIVIMGEAFVDKDIADGTYERVMKDAMEELFTIEPMKSLRAYFDVYMVNAVSKDNVVSSTTSTAFSTEFHPGSTEITGDDAKCEKYALKAIDKERKNDALVLVIINDERYAGTCSLTVTSDTKNEVPSGLSIAYIPMVNDGKGSFEQVLHHEAIGHGLGKLDDEYGSEDIYRPNGSILDDSSKDNKDRTPLDILKVFQGYFALLNVSLESDVMKTPWKVFYEDDLYA
ncbi:MAG: hypothetical protein HUJ99_07005, partial [Bacteroidaceae bacterium]|nr:hypothetical protein [Bacteroidaceae bacterium]